MDTASKASLMQTIIEKFQAASKTGDLFGYWQQEMQLRQALRNAEDWINIRISDPAEYDFLKRGLYYGPGHDIFLDVVIQNMDNQAVVDSVINSSRQFVSDLLGRLKSHIISRHPAPQTLGFLINVFNDNIFSEYQDLVNVIDEDLCSYLMSRTSNKTLRRLLKDRLATIKEEKNYSAVTAKTATPKEWSTIHGDKIQLLNLSSKMLQELNQNILVNQAQTVVDKLLDCASLLFRAGLLADCMGLLAKTLIDSGFEKDNPFLDRSDSYYRQVNRLLGKVVPLHSLLIDPIHPRAYALENYRSLFPGFMPDPAALLYLDLYAITLKGLQGQRQYARYEILQIAAKLHNSRRDDCLAAGLVDLNRSRSLSNVDNLVKNLSTQLKQYPHETYIGLEIIRFCHLQGLTSLNKKAATDMLRTYLEMFYWLPGAAFLNDTLVKHLGPLAEDDCRIEAEDILSGQHIYMRQDQTDSPGQTPTYILQPPRLKKIMAMSKIMGVF